MVFLTVAINGTGRQVKSSFSYEVFLDYFSLNNKPGEKLKSHDIVDGWKKFLPKFTFTHHVITNFEIAVTSVHAQEFCKGQALHCLANAEGGERWTVAGTYDFRLSKFAGNWKVDSMIFNLVYEDGNKDLPRIIGEMD